MPIDFVIVAESPKLTKVREIKNQADYNPATDFWKPLRDEIRAHPDGARLESLLADLTDPKRINRYSSAIKGYKKFVGRRQFEWFLPSNSRWTHGDLVVRVNPEVGFEMNGIRTILKLYFKDEAPNKRRLEVVFEMLREALCLEPPSTVMAVLDINSGVLRRANAKSLDVAALLRAEATAFTELWNSL